MTIYASKIPDYRKIYKNHYGNIPVDIDGRTYDIHHIDGNRNNNDISNLIAVTIREHYDIHYKLGHYGACLRMSERMKLSPEEKSQIAKLNAQLRVIAGTHNFLGESNNDTRIQDGTHHLLGPAVNRKRLDNGTHHFLIEYLCPKCGKTGKGPSMKNHHFENCKS